MEEKKNNTKNSKTKTIKKVTRKKTAVPNKEPFSVKTKRFLSSYSFLYTLFAFLLVFVIALFIIATIKGHERKDNQSNIVFSIMDNNTRNYIDIDLPSLKGHQYLLKITNHRNGKINKSGAEYMLTVINNSNAEIEIKQDDNLENLMKDQKQTIIQGAPFSKTKKEETVFYFQIKENSEVKEGDTLRIEVES